MEKLPAKQAKKTPPFECVVASKNGPAEGGRAGAWFACEHAGAMPDLVCLGKALTGGFPLSACVGRADLMDQA